MHSLENIPRFFVDAMLGNIAKKLRLLGYDTKYSSNIADDNLIEFAKVEDRIIISRDNDLVNKAENSGIKSIFLQKASEGNQLFEIAKKMNIKKLIINGNSARCPKCNFLTIPVEKNTIRNEVSKGILEFNKKFWKCEDCNQIYWEGTHIKNLKKLINEINERL